MSRLLLWDAVRAPLQMGEETMYDAAARAFVADGELFYYRVSEHYRDWIEVFNHTGESLGSYRTLSHFKDGRGTKSQRTRLFKTPTGKALHRELHPLIGHRIVAIELIEEEGLSLPYSVLLLDDGRQVVLQSDPEGNGGGFPNVVKPA